jgi:nickel transport protein
MKRLLLPGLIGVAGLLLAPHAARAHGIESSLERLGSLGDSLSSASGNTKEMLRLESHFSNGLPASDALVRVAPPGGGTPIEVGRTDAAGRITFKLPPQASRQWEVQVDAGPGHRDYLELPEAGKDGSPAARETHSRPYALSRSWPSLLPLGVFAAAGLAGLVWHRRQS